MLLKLCFTNTPNWELSEIIFGALNKTPKIARRGKSLVYRDDDGCFQWTRAVKALALLAVGTKLLCDRNSPNIFFIQGSAGSHAASLDFAVSKPTQWIADLFVDHKLQNDQRRRVFRITNSEQKLPGPVQIQFANALFEANALQIVNEAEAPLTTKQLEEIYKNLEAQFPKSEKSERLFLDSPSKTRSEVEGWHRSKELIDQIVTNTATALTEVELLEPLGLEHALNRLKRIGLNSAEIAQSISGIRALIPDQSIRYKKEADLKIEPRINCIKIGAPPMAITPIILLKAVAARNNFPIEFYLHHNSSSSVIASLDDGTLDFVILSWSALNKLLLQQTDDPPKALALLPRTGLDLVASENFCASSKIPIFLASEKEGYPNQLLESLLIHSALEIKRLEIKDSSLVEIVTQLSSKDSCLGIISEPFSTALKQFSNCKIDQKAKAHSRIADNILVDLGFSNLNQNDLAGFLAAIRQEWINLLEEPERLSRCVKELFSDPTYLKTLNQVGGLYKFNQV